MKITTPSRNLFLLTALLLVVLLLSSTTMALARGLVTGRYLSASGKNIVLSLSIGSPSPANLIVEQYISPGTVIVSTSPKARKVNARQGKVKWLFRNTRSGTMQLVIRLKAPFRGSVEAMARYRDPRTGQFTELQIDP